MSKRFWLMKSEPDVYSIDTLKKDKTTWWEGVRNYQARNFMVQDMKIGDEVLFYHSNAEPPGIAGRAVVSQAANPDRSALDPKSEYYDPKATKDKPIWQCVQVTFAEKFDDILTLPQLKSDPVLQDMLVIKKGQRLSVQPVGENEFHHIIKKAKALDGR